LDLNFVHNFKTGLDTKAESPFVVQLGTGEWF